MSTNLSQGISSLSNPPSQLTYKYLISHSCLFLTISSLAFLICYLLIGSTLASLSASQYASKAIQNLNLLQRYWALSASLSYSLLNLYIQSQQCTTILMSLRALKSQRATGQSSSLSRILATFSYLSPLMTVGQTTAIYFVLLSSIQHTRCNSSLFSHSLLFSYSTSASFLYSSKFFLPLSLYQCSRTRHSSQQVSGCPSFILWLLMNFYWYSSCLSWAQLMRYCFQARQDILSGRCSILFIFMRQTSRQCMFSTNDTLQLPRATSPQMRDRSDSAYHVTQSHSSLGGIPNSHTLTMNSRDGNVDFSSTLFDILL